MLVLEEGHSLGQTRLVLRVHMMGDIISLRVGGETYCGAFHEVEKMWVRMDVFNGLIDSKYGSSKPSLILRDIWF